MKKEEFLPIDLGHLEDKARAIVHCFKMFHSADRSPEYKEVMLRRAESIADTLVRDFAYYFDTKIFNGRVPMGLDEVKTELVLPPPQREE